MESKEKRKGDEAKQEEGKNLRSWPVADEGEVEAVAGEEVGGGETIPLLTNTDVDWRL